MRKLLKKLLKYYLCSMAILLAMIAICYFYAGDLFTRPKLPQANGPKLQRRGKVVARNKPKAMPKPVDYTPYWGCYRMEREMVGVGFQPLFADLDHQPTHKDRWAVISAQGKELSSNVRETLYSYMLYEADRDMKDLWVKDETLRLMERQKHRPPEYLDFLIFASQHSATSGEFRGYVVQHLRSAYEWADELERERIRTAMYKLLDDYRCHASGTAVLSLAKLAQQYPGFDISKISEAASRLASSGATDQASRITAIQICGELGVQDFAPIARDLAKSGDSMAMRLVAISSLGDVGTEEDIAFLENVLANDHRLYHNAALRALSRLRQRLATNQDRT